MTALLTAVGGWITGMLIANWQIDSARVIAIAQSRAPMRQEWQRIVRERFVALMVAGTRIAILRDAESTDSNLEEQHIVAQRYFELLHELELLLDDSIPSHASVIESAHRWSEKIGQISSVAWDEKVDDAERKARAELRSLMKRALRDIRDVDPDYSTDTPLPEWVRRSAP